MRTLKKDLLEIDIFPTRDQMGAVAAEQAAEYIAQLLETKDEVNIVFAAAPSQNDFLAYLSKKNLPWCRINAFHMDEYIGLAPDAPQGFGNFLKERIFDLVPFKSVHYLYSTTQTPEEVCASYTQLLKDYPIDIIFMGVGENGHIAFNDPHVADFNDPLDVKIVDLDARCRQQQVNDGCFATLADVPTHAISLTCSMMMRAGRLFIVAPTALKAEAISKIYNGEITESCPASITRTHPAATLYTDEPGASKI